MNNDPIVSAQLRSVDETWPIDPDEQLRRFIASRESTPPVSHDATRSLTAKSRVLAGAVAFTVFILGGLFAWRAFHATSGPSPAATPSPPTPIVVSTTTFDTGLRFLEGAVVADGSVWIAGLGRFLRRGSGRPDGSAYGQGARADRRARSRVEFGGAGLTAARGSVWIASGPSRDQAAQGGGWLYRIDPATDTVADAVRIGNQSPADLWVDDAGIWVLSWGDAAR